MKNIFRILVLAILFVSCSTDDVNETLTIEEQFIEYTEEGSYKYTSDIAINPDINSVEAQDLSGLMINIAIEDADPYSGKIYQLNGNDELARVYFEIDGVQTFLSNGTLKVTQISDNELMGEFESTESVNNYYTYSTTQNDSIGQPYQHRIECGKFYFKSSL